MVPIFGPSCIPASRSIAGAQEILLCAIVDSAPAAGPKGIIYDGESTSSCIGQGPTLIVSRKVAEDENVYCADDSFAVSVCLSVCLSVGVGAER